LYESFQVQVNNGNSGCAVTTATPIVYKTSIVVTLNQDNSGCTSDTLFPIWAIITISAVGGVLFLVILLLVVILATPKLRESIFPYRDVPPEYHFPEGTKTVE